MPSMREEEELVMDQVAQSPLEQPTALSVEDSVSSRRERLKQRLIRSLDNVLLVSNRNSIAIAGGCVCV